jgi:hypothetical protein
MSDDDLLMVLLAGVIVLVPALVTGVLTRAGFWKLAALLVLAAGGVWGFNFSESETAFGHENRIGAGIMALIAGIAAVGGVLGIVVGGVLRRARRAG